MSCIVDKIVDSILNGKPRSNQNINYPCSICNKSVNQNQMAIQCDSCDLWVHIKCNGTSSTEYEQLKIETDPWFCLVCNVNCNLINVPFTICDNFELLNINNAKSMHFLESLPSVDIINETLQFSNLSTTDINDELPYRTSCKYYSVNEFEHLNINKKFNIFHTNINGLDSKIHNLHEFLSDVTGKLDILAITETSENDNVGFLCNVDIEGYNKIHTPSMTSKGGSALYVNSSFESFERLDLSIKNDEFESTWAEIKNSKSKNIVCGSIYRHPHYNFKEFFIYLEKCLSKLVKENKELYLCGDFNFDLLKIDNDINTHYFFNLLCSFGLLPHILQPTRVTEYTATVIDNIFSNNIQDDITSGNLLLTLSEHFCQFVSVKREKIDYKKTNIYVRDYSKFNAESFRDDVSIQNWDYLYHNVNDSFKDFYYKLEGTVSRHAPLKKLTPKEIKLKQKPWLTKEILKMIKTRDKIFARKKRQPNNINCKLLYNLFRNRVNREIKKSKKNYYVNYFDSNVNNIKTST